MINKEEITFDTIVKYVDEVKEMYVNRLIEKTKPVSMKKPVFMTKFIRISYDVTKKILMKVGVDLIKKSDNEGQYHFIEDKRWYLDFFAYCLANRNNLVFDLSLFKDKNDKNGILKFVKNKVYGALCEYAEIDVLFDQEDLAYEKRYEQMAKEVRNKENQYYLLNWNGMSYKLSINWFEPVVFYHKYGIPQLPDTIMRTLAGKDSIDCGAFIGDSTLMLKEFNPKRVFAFEPLEENVKLLRKTVELNHLSNVAIVKKGLSCHEGTVMMQPATSQTLVHKLGSQKTDMTTIDRFVDRNGLSVGLIKMDIEGYEFDAIKGSEKTIKSQKPVLIISLYHDGKSFFEIPNLLNKWVPEYNFRFLNLNRIHPTFERVLVAYNEERN